MLALFSGGRALAENPQLDRLLPLGSGEAEVPTIDITSIPGISTRAMDFPAPSRAPDLDPLATAIPADQHAVFFSSPQPLLSLAAEFQGRGLAFVQILGARAESPQTLRAYERQLAITANDLAPTIAEGLVQTIALTGSDPYFPTGTDVAVLFETNAPDELEAFLRARIEPARRRPGVEPVSGVAGGVSYSGYRSPDRSTCSYLAGVGRTIVLSNSTAQIERLVSVGADAALSISPLPEYAFFRDCRPPAP